MARTAIKRAAEPAPREVFDDDDDGSADREEEEEEGDPEEDGEQAARSGHALVVRSTADHAHVRAVHDGAMHGIMDYGHDAAAVHAQKEQG